MDYLVEDLKRINAVFMSQHRLFLSSSVTKIKRHNRDCVFLQVQISRHKHDKSSGNTQSEFVWQRKYYLASKSSYKIYVRKELSKVYEDYSSSDSNIDTTTDDDSFSVTTASE